MSVTSRKTSQDWQRFQAAGLLVQAVFPAMNSHLFALNWLIR